MTMKKMGIVFLASICLISMSACSKKTEDSTSTKKAESLTVESKDETTTEKTEDTSSDTKEEETVKGGATAAGSVATDVESGDKNVYFANENADGYDSVTFDEEVTPEALMQILVEKGVVSSDVTVLSCNETEVDGEKAIDLDLSNAFLTALSNSGSTGESVTVGSVCDTFLSGYGASKIKITVEGEPLITEHAEYTNYMSAY